MLFLLLVRRAAAMLVEATADSPASDDGAPGRHAACEKVGADRPLDRERLNLFSLCENFPPENYLLKNSIKNRASGTKLVGGE